jgi:tRNA(Arg) A34 adenosine deaminase TadA
VRDKAAIEKRGRIMSDDSGGAIFIEALLEAMESAIIPLTRIGVSRGNKIFGAALLRKNDLKVVIAETNNEMQNPLWHGEIHAIKRFYELPASGRPPVRAHP